MEWEDHICIRISYVNSCDKWWKRDKLNVLIQLKVNIKLSIPTFNTNFLNTFPLVYDCESLSFDIVKLKQIFRYQFQWKWTVSVVKKLVQYGVIVARKLFHIQSLGSLCVRVFMVIINKILKTVTLSRTTWYVAFMLNFNFEVLVYFWFVFCFYISVVFVK